MRARLAPVALALVSVGLLPLAHCSSIPDYEAAPPTIDGSTDSPLPDGSTPLQDASIDVTRGVDAADAPVGCTPTVIDPSEPTAADTCRWAMPLAWKAGSVRFGALGSPAFAVTTSYVFLVSRGHLWRLPRSLWLAPGGASFEQCGETDLGAVVGTVQNVLPFDTDGVCVHVLASGRHSVQCAGTDESALRWVPTLGLDEQALPPLASNGGAVTTSLGYLVFARADGRGYRYGRADSAPTEMQGLVGDPADIGPLSAIPTTTVASRFCDPYRCNRDLVYLDPVGQRAGTEGVVPWPDTTKVRTFARVGTQLLGLHDDGSVKLLEGGGITLFNGVSVLVGSRTDSESFAVFVSDTAPEGPANWRVLTPERPREVGDTQTPRRSTPALLSADGHRAVLDGNDLFVATMPTFGCAPGMAWIAKLPRFLE